MDAEPAGDARAPRTERGRRTRRALLDAATAEFGELGFHAASISGITRRAGTALGSFYTWFDGKDAIFRALVRDMSEGVAARARAAIEPDMSALEKERAALEGFLAFVGENRSVYRIIDEAEFVDPDSYRRHYETIAERIAARLRAGTGDGAGDCADDGAGDGAGDWAGDGGLRSDLSEVEAWALMGMNVFLGLRYAVWSEPDDPSQQEVIDRANALLARGISTNGPG